MMIRSLVCVFLAFLIGFATPELGQRASIQQEQEQLPKGDAGKRIKKIRSYIGEAGQLYKNEDYQAAGKKISAAQSLLERAVATGSEEYRGVIEKEYRRVAKAHELLTAKSIELSPLKPLPKKLGPDPSLKESNSSEIPADAVSFKSDVVPLIVKHCGTCHVEGSRGQFSMRTYEDLMDQLKGKAVVAGKPAKSEVIKMIEDGSMPPGRKTVPEKEIEVFRKWVQQGAKFDSEDKNKSVLISKIKDEDG